MADKKISQLDASALPLAGTEVLPIVQSGVTKKTSVESVLTSVQPSGTANGVLYLNGSKVAVSGSALTFTGVNLGLGAGTLFPSAPHPLASQIRLGLTGNSYSQNNAGLGIGGAWLLNNAYVKNSTGDFAYITSAKASAVSCVNGQVLIRRSTGTDTADDPTTFATTALFDDAGNVTVSTGNLIIGTAGKGIDFSADSNAAGMTSELLNDYEEGTWTPSITGSTSNSGQAYTLQEGRYTKIGRLVNVQFHIKFSAEGTFSGSLLQLSGLPFTINSTPPAVSGGMLQFGDMAANYITIGLQLNQGSTIAFLTAMTAGATGTGYVGINDLTDTTLLTGQFTYFV